MTRRLQTASPEIVALILEALNTSRADDTTSHTPATPA